VQAGKGHARLGVHAALRHDEAGEPRQHREAEEDEPPRARPADAVGAIVARASDRSAPGASICVFAADSLLKCRDDPRLAAIANGSWMTLCDGMPLVLLGRLAAHLPVGRCYGPDVMLGVLDRGRAAGLRHYFYGGADEESIKQLNRVLQGIKK